MSTSSSGVYRTEHQQIWDYKWPTVGNKQSADAMLYSTSENIPQHHEKMDTAWKRYQHLIRAYQRIADAEVKSPNPLLEQLLLRISEALRLPENANNPLLEDEELKDFEINMVENIKMASSSRGWQGNLDPVSEAAFRETHDPIMGRGFEEATMAIIEQIPFWQSHKLPLTPGSENGGFGGGYYDPASENQRGMSLQQFVQVLNNINLDHSQKPKLTWDSNTAIRYLKVMHSRGLIRFEPGDNYKCSRVSRVPLWDRSARKCTFGEGSFVASRFETKTLDSEAMSPSRFSTESENSEYIRDCSLLERISFRLGREIIATLKILASRPMNDGQQRLDHLVVRRQRSPATDQGIPVARQANSGISRLSTQNNLNMKARSSELWSCEGTPTERYYGADHAPYYPFGETPYQEWVLSRRMEHDLSDVKEFHPQGLNLHSLKNGDAIHRAPTDSCRRVS